MRIYYQGKDITEAVQVRKCVARDTAGERCDSLDIEFENAAAWYDWGPEEDDQILVSQDGYDTGVHYLNTVLPEGDKYRIFATSLPCRARKKEYRSFRGKSIEEILRTCAMVSGMDFRIFGIDGNTVIPYIQQENESCAAFLHRLLQMEGAALKCINGRYAAIGILWAQERAAHQTIELSARQSGTEYRRSGVKARALTLRTPYGSATAEDLAVPGSHARIILNNIPARNNLQAGRWARGLLLHENRQCESLTVQSEFNAGFTAMTRINITGSTGASGEWLIEKAEHDFINRTSTARMHRCIRTIQ